jgi:hypothetical protein
MAVATVETRLAKVKPSGERRGTPIYAVRDAAPYCVPLPADAVDRVLRMNHMGLPALLKKEYWQGQEAQLRVREKQGSLWRTDKILEYVGMAFRDIATEINIFSDQVERESALTERQKEAIDTLTQNLLLNIKARIKLSFDGVFDDPDGRNAGSILDEEQPGTEAQQNGASQDPFEGIDISEYGDTCGL